MDDLSLVPSADIWAEMQRLREVLVSREALCGNCGCYLNPDEPHSPGGLGMCFIGKPRTDSQPKCGTCRAVGRHFSDCSEGAK